jgi:hypothetical protein
MQGQIETAKAQGGLVRITVPGTAADSRYVHAGLHWLAARRPRTRQRT